MQEPPIRDQALERALPHSSEAERSVIGNILIDNEIIYQAIQTLRPPDFYVPSHRKIYDVIERLYELGSEISPVLIAEELAKENQLESVGGVTFITGLMNGVVYTGDISDLCKVVKGHSTLRQLIRAANKITQDALEQEDDPKTILQRAGQSIFDIVIEQTQTGFKPIGQLVQRSIQRAQQAQANGNQVTGLSSGFPDIDSKTLGWQRTDFIIVAGRPSMGKTALALMFSQNAAIRLGASVIFFSLEMSEDSISSRVVCSEAGVDSLRYRNGYLTPEEWDRVHAVEPPIGPSRIFVDDTPGLTVLQMRAAAQRYMVEHGPIDLMVVDSIQLMAGVLDKGKSQESRQQEVSKISRDLKGLAKVLNVPLMAISTLSRAPESRSDHRPILSDLRESGQIEYDADQVLFVYRDEMYKSQTEQAAQTEGVAEIIIAKNRNGPVGTVPMRFHGPSARFDSLYQEPQH